MFADQDGHDLRHPDGKDDHPAERHAQKEAIND
jgi:hypothetical protein